MTESHSSGPEESEPGPRSSSDGRVTETDLAILTAFCRPYLDGEWRFAVPTPNNEILHELAQNGIYLDLDTLRGHLRTLYAKFGIDEGLNPAQKRARLAELVYENGVIAGWEPREEGPREVPATASAVASPSRLPASLVPGAPEAREAREAPTASRWRGIPHARWWAPAGVAVLMLGAVLAFVALRGSERTPARDGAPGPTATADTKASILRKSLCQPRQFCLARFHNMSGGLYQSVDSDHNLGDDIFYYYGDPAKNKQMGPVTGQTWSAWNRSGRDVIVYEGPNASGKGACIHAGPQINLHDSWKDRISSFRFATRSVCNRYEVLADVNG